VVDWWLYSTTFGMAGPAGPPEWPRPGGLLNQRVKLADAVTILRNAWPHVTAPKHEREPEPPAKEPLVRRHS
jgi:hypothetical protein